MRVIRRLFDDTQITVLWPLRQCIGNFWGFATFGTGHFDYVRDGFKLTIWPKIKIMTLGTAGIVIVNYTALILPQIKQPVLVVAVSYFLGLLAGWIWLVRQARDRSYEEAQSDWFSLSLVEVLQQVLLGPMAVGLARFILYWDLLILP